MTKVKEDISRVRLEVDGKQGINTLGKLEMEAKELKIEYKNIQEQQKKWANESKNLDKIQLSLAKILDRQKELQKAGKENTKEYQKLDQSYEKIVNTLQKARIAAENFKKTEQQLIEQGKKLDSSTAEIEKMRGKLGLAGMTMRQLINHAKDLRKQLYTSATFGTDEWHRLEVQLREVNNELLNQRTVLRGGLGGKGFFGNISKEMSSLAASAGIFLGAQGIVMGFQKLIGASSEFEQSISNLSAITGATGEDLEKLEEAARRIGSTTTLSAQQTADAFTIIASKKPELLENNDALIATTESAIMLAEAAGIDLPTAADALTNSLNQFEVGADQANRFVNVLAAGSKFGAGEIDYLNDAVKRFGPIAASMNISIEQSVAMMEVFAEKGIESEKAGTQFRNILLKMATGADEFNPKIVGMQAAIENMSDANLSAAEKVKLFGVENFLAGEVMLASADRFQEFTGKVTGTSVALEQATVRVDNFKGDMKSLSSITEEYLIIIGGLISDGLRPMVQAITAGLIALKETPKFIQENKDLFIALGIALVTFNTAQIASTALMIKDIAIKKGQAIWTGAVTTAQTLLNNVMTANPIGLVIKAVGLLTAGFVILYNRSENVRAGIAGIAEVAMTVWEIIKETFGAFTDGFSKILDGDVTGGLKQLGQAIIRTNPVGLAMTEGKRLAESFAKGYKDKLASEQASMNPGLITNQENLSENSTTNTNLGDPANPGDLNDSNADSYTEQAIQIMRSTQEAIAAPELEAFDAVTSHFDKMKALHEQFGLDISSQEQARDAARIANGEAFRAQELEDEKAMADAKMMIAQGLSSSLGAIIDLVGNKQGELTSFQKALTVAQIAIDTAASLSGIIPLAVKAAGKDGPAAPFTFAGYIAAMAATVFGAVARAKNALSDSNVPQYNGGPNEVPSGRSRSGTPVGKKSFYFGGYTGDAMMGGGDQYGPFAGPVHQREYVIPEVTVSDPFVANLLPAIEQIRQDGIRGMGGSSSKIAMDTSKLEKKIDQLIGVVAKQQQKMKAYLVYTELEEMEEENELLKTKYGA